MNMLGRCHILIFFSITPFHHVIWKNSANLYIFYRIIIAIHYKGLGR